MTGKTSLSVGIVLIILLSLGALFYYERAEAPTDGGSPGGSNTLPEPPPPSELHGAAAKADLITLDSLQSGAKISSPLSITGRARGNWYFEASFPVRILDGSGTIVASGPAQAQSDWMTTEFVPFSITLSFPKQQSGSRGFVILHNDNPSGDPERDDYLEIPVIF